MKTKNYLPLVAGLLFTTLNFTSCNQLDEVSQAPITPAASVELISDSESRATEFNAIVDISTLTTDYTASDGETLTGTLTNKVKISIAPGATVVLKDLTINGTPEDYIKMAGITCVGNATLILEGINKVSGFHPAYPGIFIKDRYTLTIEGDGELHAISPSSSSASGIGGGLSISMHENIGVGNIVIKSGTIFAQGGMDSAGIGSSSACGCGDITILGGNVKAVGGYHATGIGTGDGAPYWPSRCGNITIAGGIVEATGGFGAAAIGTGADELDNAYYNSCGNITITAGVAQVTATKGEGAEHSIGKGSSLTSFGTITIGNANGPIAASPYQYQP